MSGYIALHRDAFEHPLLRDAERFKAWFWLVSRACWKETRYDIRGKTVTLQRGQLCTSRTQLSEELGWSQSAVERFLTRLETEQMIGRATGQGKSIVTICNYDKYQQAEDETGQATGQATGQKSDSNRTAKEEGKERKKYNNTPLPPKGAQIPDWVPSEPWSDFVAMRIRIKKPMTDRAKQMAIKKLAELMDHGHDIAAVLDQSVFNSWQDLYPIKAAQRTGAQRMPQVGI